jgi:hypothetical protein
MDAVPDGLVILDETIVSSGAIAPPARIWESACRAIAA